MSELRSASAVRKAAIEGLGHAAHLVGYFGWAPPSPEEPRLNLGVTLNLSACKMACKAGEPVYGIEALMGYLLEQHLKSVATNDCQGLVDWECADGRTVEEIITALQDAAASS